MSIVVWDGNTLYSDVFAVSAGRSLHYSKIRKLHDVTLSPRFLSFVTRASNRPNVKEHNEQSCEVLVGCTGSVSNSEAFFEWVSNGVDFALWPACLKEDAECLLAFKFEDQYVLLRFSDSMYPFVIHDKLYGIGYGWPYIQGFLDAGGSIEEAIKQCGVRTPFVRGGDEITTPKCQRVGFT